MSATEMIANAVRERTHGWIEERLGDFLFVFGDPVAEKPGRHVICDGTTDHPIIIANAGGVRMTLGLPHVSDGGDRQSVLLALEALGVIDPVYSSAVIVKVGQDGVGGIVTTP